MHPARTATGNYPIGFRRLASSWQESTARVAQWALDNRFSFVDLRVSGASADLATLSQAGLLSGQVDLLDFAGYEVIIAPDSAQRQSGIAATTAHIETCAAAGAALFFCVTIPQDKQKPRLENFDYLVDSFAALAPTLERTKSRLAIEGWPGPGAVCCTPETYRAFFRAIGSDRFGINYDPSHLLRMGIDPVRFAEEFAARIFHVHGKDTELFSEDMYERGHEQPPTFARNRRWGGPTWRYAIPGRGQCDWAGIFRALAASEYGGLVSVELEDENHNGTEAGEQRGLIAARSFLEGC